MSAARDASRGADRPSAETARRLVLEQHWALRRLLMMGLAQAGKAGGHQDPRHEPLRALVGEMQSVFVQHLADEEGLILPILEDDLPLGPIRAEALRQEHARQREELEALCAWPEERSDYELATRFRRLAAALLEDITREECEILTSDIVRQDSVVIDQCGG